MNLGTLTFSLGVDISRLGAATAAVQTFEKQVEKSMAVSAQRIRTFGYLASATLTAPMVMFGKSAIDAASEFDFAMAKIEGLVGIARSQVNAWKQDLLKMGPEVGKTPLELAEALYFVTSSGFKSAEALNIVKLSAQAAAAGLGETQEVANLVTSAMMAYKQENLQSVQVIDQLIAAVREGKAEAPEFAKQIGTIVPYAAKLKLSFDQVTGAVAAMTLQGASAANASTYLRNFLMKLIHPAAQSEAALNKLGISSEFLRKMLAEKGLIAVMERLNSITNIYGVETLGEIFPNIRALMAVLNMTGQNAEEVRKVMEATANATGSLQKATEAASESLKLRLNKVMSSVKASMISFGETLGKFIVPFLEKLSKKLEQLVTWFNGLSVKTQENIIKAVALLAALGPLTLIFSTLQYVVIGFTKGITKLITGFNFLITIVPALTGHFKALKTAMTISPATTKGLWFIFNRLTPMMSAVGGLAGVTAVATVGFVKYVKRVKEMAKEHDTFNTALVKVGESIKNLKNLTKNDFADMDMAQLAAAQASIQAEWAAAYKLYEQGIKNRENYGFLGAGKKNNEKFIQEQIDKIAFLKKLYDDINTVAKERGAIVTGVLKTETAAVGELVDEMKQLEKITMKTPYVDPTTGFRERWQDTVDWFKQRYNFKEGLYEGNWEQEAKAIEKYNEKLENQKTIIDRLDKSFTELFYNTGDGFKGMIESMLDSLKLLLAQLVAKAAIYAILQMLFPASDMAVHALTNLRKFVGTIPGFANGTNYAPGGLSLVGERGPELVNLPRGAQVIPNARLSMDPKQVVFVIKGPDLVGILEKANRVNRNY
jgi:TP901 family phage tail tape measure protein